MKYEYLKNHAHSLRQQALFVLGAGPSLLENDLRLLRTQTVLCINHAVWFARDYLPTYWAWRDYWAPEFQKYIRPAAYRGIIVFTQAAPNLIDDPVPEQLVQLNACGVPGHCCAVTLDLALGLAIHLGYKRVYLLGLDNGPYRGREHLVLPNGQAGPAPAGFNDLVIENFRRHLELYSCGVHHGLTQLPHLSLQQAVGKENG